MSADFLTASDIADLREVAESAMADRHLVHAPPSSSAANKGEDSSTEPVLIAENVKCKLRPTIRQSREVLTAGQLQSVGDWTVEQPAGDTWTASTALSLGAVVVPTVETGRRYVVKTPGTTGASEPAWPTALHGEVTNGTVVFKEFSIRPSYRITITTQANRSFEVTKPVAGTQPTKMSIECKEL